MTAAVAGNARTFDPSPASVRAARSFVREALEESEFDAVSESGALLASELVTNAVLHARTSFTVEIDVADARVRVTVRDGSVSLPAPRQFSELAGSGRGLQLVDTLADRWGIDPERGGKRVWFELTADGAGAYDLDAVDPI